ncbi:hypothetical protein A3Q56_03575 [Intoshia linei]|uniref:Uncharacterized protein n=1 Tax=Intoshia linei TaxID=1819745 RepID=A0A177B340_9BILA|nr:hypothetical protein A3Q56_03575 [Intoshia linei]
MKYILIFAATIWMCQSVHALHGHFGDLLKRDNTSIESGDHIANDETSDNGISVPMQIKLIFEKRRKNKNSIENQNYGNGIGKNKKNHREGKGKGKNRKQKGKKHTGKGGRKNHPEKQKDKFDMAEFESIPKKITDDGINEFGKLSQLTQLTLESENENEDGLINAEYDDEICPKSIKNQNKILHKVGKKKLKRAGRSIHNSFKKNGKKLHKFVEYVNNIDPIQTI